jgi:hypothetical protein
MLIDDLCPNPGRIEFEQFSKLIKGKSRKKVMNF